MVEMVSLVTDHYYTSLGRLFMAEKKCSYCNETKAIEDFPKGRMCKACKSVYDKQYYLNNKTKIDLRANAYGQTERGREVNRKAALRHGRNGRRAELVQAYKDRLNPEDLAEYRKRQRVHSQVQVALNKGTLKKSDVCMLCGSDQNIEAHHPDYGKPLEVIWMFKSCHGITWRKRKQMRMMKE